MSFNTYGQKSKTAGAPVQVWAEVTGVKAGGGTIDAAAFAALPVGAVIPAGTPVNLDKSGGVLTPIYFYELKNALTAADTEAVLYGSVPLPASGGNLIVVPDTIGGTGTGVAYSAAVDNGDGTYTVTIAAGALGTAAAGTILAEADGAGDGAAVENAVVPNGLLWNDIVKEEGDTVASGAVVDAGRIYADRAPALPTAYEKHLEYIGIKFEKGI